MNERKVMNERMNEIINYLINYLIGELMNELMLINNYVSDKLINQANDVIREVSLITN